MDICIDFDGTCVTHDFPLVGKDIGSVPVLKKLVESGHNLILFTMRSNMVIKSLVSQSFLTDALCWFKENDIPLYGVNSNPRQSTWTSSPKAEAQLYIDDAALGCPLKFNPELSSRPFVDWNVVEQILIYKGVIKE